MLGLQFNTKIIPFLGYLIINDKNTIYNKEAKYTYMDS